VTGEGAGRDGGGPVGDGEVGDGEVGVADLLAHHVGSALRALRASRSLSQRALAASAGVSKSELARLEAESPPPAVSRWCGTLAALGLRVTVQPLEKEDAWVVPPPHLDAAGRRFPAHGFAERRATPPTWWFVRNGGWGTKTPEPDWFWHRRRRRW
jgi:transcriptional regulator with XRE-family HTH domain